MSFRQWNLKRLLIRVPQTSAQRPRRMPLKATEELVEWVADSLASHGFQAGTVVKPGDPREVIVNEAADWQADLIVMGAYGHSGVRNWQIGSVAESVAKHARCSVELVRKQRTSSPDRQDE